MSYGKEKSFNFSAMSSQLVSDGYKKSRDYAFFDVVPAVICGGKESLTLSLWMNYFLK